MTGLEKLNSIQFVVDQEGRPAAVQMSIAAWESLLDYLDDLEDRAYIKEMFPRLRKGPGKGRVLEWGKVKGDWESTEKDD